MGTCLSRCYPETNTSSNGFSNSVKGNERTVKCEYRRIFKGHRHEESKKWSSSTSKGQKSISGDIPSHTSLSVRADRCLPSVPTGPLIDNETYNILTYSKGDQNGYLDYDGQNGDISTAVDSKLMVSSFQVHENGNSFCSNSVNMNKNINELFEKYYEPEQDCILADGIERLCNDLCLQPDDFRVLLLAWHFEAETMCCFTRKEFFRGFRKLKVDNIQSLRSKIFAGCACKKCSTCKQDEVSDKSKMEEDEKGDDDHLYGRIYPSHEDGPFITEVTANRESFKNVYKWSYRFALDIETGQRTLPLDMAMSMWQLIFSKRLLFFERNSGYLNEAIGIKSSNNNNSQESFQGSQSILTSFMDKFKEALIEKEVCEDIPVCYIAQNSVDRNEKDATNHQSADNADILASLCHALPIVRSWFQFLFSLKGSLRGITRDTWDMFFTFIESVGDDGSGYNDAEAWPSLFDDFIEWLNDKNHD